MAVLDQVDSQEHALVHDVYDVFPTPLGLLHMQITTTIIRSIPTTRQGEKIFQNKCLLAAVEETAYG